MVESVKMDEESGTESVVSEVWTKIVVGVVVGKDGVDEIIIVMGIGEVMVSDDGGLIGGGGAGAVRFRNGSWIMEWKIFKVGADEERGDDTFRMGSKFGSS